jgi:hypothetical protein
MTGRVCDSTSKKAESSMGRTTLCFSVATLTATAMLLTACEDGRVVLRSRADADISAPSNPDDPLAAQCSQLRDQIRADQESVREAPTISTSPQIVEAAEGKADLRIDDLRSHMDTLGCSDQAGGSSDSAQPARMAPFPAAPNAPNR